MKNAQPEDGSSFNPPSPEDCTTGEMQAQEDPPVHDTEDCHSNNSESDEDPPVHDTKNCHTDDIESEEYPAIEESALEARKSEFYAEVDKKLAAISPDQRAKHIMSDDQFNEIMNFLLSIRTATPERRLSIMKSYPNKVAYKWVKRYDLLVVNTSNTLIYKQEPGAALDSCLRVAHYSNVFNVVREIHELEMGNDHPKNKTLYKRVFAKYGKSIPRWICEMFPMFCPICIRAKVRRKPKAGHQPLLTRGMGVRAQIDLIDYQSMPDGTYNYVLDYQDHGIKFCQLRPLRQKTHKAVAIELINIFCIFGPPSILQADNGKEFSHGANNSRHVKLDVEVRILCIGILSSQQHINLTHSFHCPNAVLFWSC
jgi:hypothetical protein